MSTSTVTGAVEPFGTRLHRAMGERGRVCVGIDPHGSLLEAWGLEDTLAGMESFALTATEAIAPHVSVVKPQSAFFERFGSRGVAVLARVVETARQAGALVCMDVKRGDIGSTSQAYADAYMDPRSDLASDAVTVSPYLGFGSLDPFVETARRTGAGIFALALTSNPEGASVQRSVTGDGRTVAASVLDDLRALNAGAEPLGSFGAVVGATIDDPGTSLAINGPLLVPGFGAQGGTVADMQRIFGDARVNVLASTSRGVLAAGPDPVALADAARAANDEVAVLGR